MAFIDNQLFIVLAEKKSKLQPKGFVHLSIKQPRPISGTKHTFSLCSTSATVADY